MVNTICNCCGHEMYARKSKLSADATQVFLCPQCETVCYIWPDGAEKWEPGNELLVAKFQVKNDGEENKRDTKHIV